MSQAPSDLIGRLAVHYKLISLEQLSAATQAQARSPTKKLGGLLVELGFINSTQLTQLVEAQRQYLAHQARQGAKVLREVQREPPARDLPREGPGGSRGAVIPIDQARARATEHTFVDEAQPMQWLQRVLQRAYAMEASDVHVHSGTPVKARIFGDLLNLQPAIVGAREAESVLLAAMGPDYREAFLEEGQVDFTYAVPGVGRFRANVYQQYGGLCGVFHHIPADPPMPADLGLPPSIARLIDHRNGIVLITGPAGSGKTSTMAALINLMNEGRSDHVISIEDPIEYRHKSKRCVVNQREVNRHTHSFGNALRSALREDPDVICIGELRDLETISLALSAAETGHLVLATLHTQGAIRTINRLVGAFAPKQQLQVRNMLSESLRAIISQKLIPRADRSGVALAYELLVVNAATSNMIRENRTYQLASVLQTGRSRGMRSMDDSLLELCSAGTISKKDALLHAEDVRVFK
jgi:twitching motility protein PilT